MYVRCTLSGSTVVTSPACKRGKTSRPLLINAKSRQGIPQNNVLYLRFIFKGIVTFIIALHGKIFARKT